MLPALIAAGASALGGYLQNKSQKAANAANVANQKQFAQQGIQWKVQDAIKAGIHPLYALGAQTTSFTPTAVGGGDLGIPDAGQNIGRAIESTRNTEASQLALRASALQLEGLNLDNELKRTQLASAMRLVNQTQLHPPLPSGSEVYPLPGQADGGIISSVPPGHDPRMPQYTSPDLALEGRKWLRTPGTSDAQTWEDVYGDESLLPFIINNYRSIRDIYENVKGPYHRRIIDKLRR